MIDETHDRNRRSWVGSADGHRDFPLQNLPLGIFRPPGGEPRGGVAIGEEILDLGAALEAGLFAGEAARAAEAAAGTTLNPLMALGRAPRLALRRRLSQILDADGAEAPKIKPLAPKLLHKRSACTLELPTTIGDYTDFFAGIHHATNTGRMFRPDNPLLPNYKYVPIAYHGRASSVVVSGTPIRRPWGQTAGPPPVYGHSKRLDYELELGFFVGKGNELGLPVPIRQAADHIFGFCLVNDWSARDIQAW